MLSKVTGRLVQGPCSFTKVGVRRKIQAAVGKYDNLLAMIKKQRPFV